MGRQRTLAGSLSDADEVKIVALWKEGLSTRQIGEAMGRTKNSIVGHASRLDLPRRPSPILRDGIVRELKPKLIGTRPTLPPLISIIPTQPVIIATPDAARWHDIGQFMRANPARQQRHNRVPKETLGADPVRPTQITTPIPKVSLRPQECCWPIGEPGTPEFRHCNVPHTNAGPYCDEHHRIAFVKVARRAQTKADPLPRVMAGYR